MRDRYDGIVVKIEPRDGVVRLRLFRLLFERYRRAFFVEFNHAVALGVRHVMREDDGSVRFLTFLEELAQTGAVKEIVAEDKHHVVLPYEFLAHYECLCETVRSLLYGVREGAAELRPVAKEPLVARRIFLRGDDEYVPNAREHHRRKRVIYHRLVVERHQLFAHPPCKRIEPCTAASCKNDALHIPIVFLFPLYGHDH